MAGPNSVPAGDKALYERLTEFVCVKHTDCVGDKATEKSPCEWLSRREWLLKSNRLRTGKTK